MSESLQALVSTLPSLLLGSLVEEEIGLLSDICNHLNKSHMTWWVGKPDPESPIHAYMSGEKGDITFLFCFVKSGDHMGAPHSKSPLCKD